MASFAMLGSGAANVVGGAVGGTEEHIRRMNDTKVYGDSATPTVTRKVERASAGDASTARKSTKNVSDEDYLRNKAKNANWSRERENEALERGSMNTDRSFMGSKNNSVAEAEPKMERNAKERRPN